MTEASDIYEICLDRKSLCCSRQWEDTCSKCKTYQMYKIGFEAGKPKWHDLRKDPQDLPTEQGYYGIVDIDGYYATIRNLVNMTHGDIATLFRANDAIAWCELPKFEE